jgi:hypothetical protein
LRKDKVLEWWRSTAHPSRGMKWGMCGQFQMSGCARSLDPILYNLAQAQCFGSLVNIGETLWGSYLKTDGFKSF